MGVRNIDEALQMVHRAIRDKAIKWNDFRPVGVEDDYHDWYYAENRLYVIHDRILDNIVFYQGKSPKDAYESWQSDIRDIWGHEEEGERYGSNTDEIPRRSLRYVLRLNRYEL